MNMAESGEGESDYQAIRLILAIGQIGPHRANRLILAIWLNRAKVSLTVGRR